MMADSLSVVGTISATALSVDGTINAEGGPGPGVYATSDNSSSAAVNGVGTNGAAGVGATSDTGDGVSGSIGSGNGVHGQSGSGSGVSGFCSSGAAVYGQSQSGIGVHAVGGGATGSVLGSPAAIFAEGGPGPGVYATSSVFPAVAGFGTNGAGGISGNTDIGTGVKGQSDSGSGVVGNSNSGDGVFGNSGSGNGVYGQSGTGSGVSAFCGTGAGVYGQSQSGVGVHAVGGGAPGSVLGVPAAIFAEGGPGLGVYATSSGGGGVGPAVGGVGTIGAPGIEGISDTGAGVVGVSNTGNGVVGFGGGWAGFFTGNVSVSGSITKASGGFKIDHPLDPANKYLYHSFVESSEMKNVYDGVVTLDSTGQIEVELPAWFEAVNRDFRYQLTPIGAPAPNLHIGRKVADGRFAIAGGQSGLEVSWQVTGVRKDAWAQSNPLEVEKEKPLNEQGFYIHPELDSEPKGKGMAWAQHPDIMRRLQDKSKTVEVMRSPPIS
jgi:hypothetical protein